MEKKHVIIVLIIIVFISAILRFYRLGTLPPELTWDEAAWGYNAFSLGIDGKDEFGRLLPIDYFESFGDFKPPVYAYLTVLPVKLFGLTALAVRFASAFFGTLTVLAAFFLTREIFLQGKYSPYNLHIGLICSGILAVSPWHINLSRAAFEANVASFFIIFGIWLFLYAIRGTTWLIFGAMVSFVLSLYTFNTARIVTPILLLCLAFAFKNKLLASRRTVLISAVVSGILCIPFLLFMLTPQAKLRYHEVNIFSDITVVEKANQAMELDRLAVGSDTIPWWSRILNNRRVGYARSYFKHYLDHFNPDFLFIRGDGNPKFSTQDTGQLYLWDLPFIVAGLVLLIRKKEGLWWFLPVWLLVGIVPAALARETPHALRIATTLPVWQMVTAYGVVQAGVALQQIRLRKFITLVTVLLLFGNIVYYLHGYHVHYAREFSGEWQYGYREAVTFTESVKDEYDAILFTQKLGRPYIYVLFYGRYSPISFRTDSHVERETYGFVHINAFKKYIFTDDVGRYTTAANKYLIVTTPEQVPEHASIIKEFNLLNGTPALIAYSL